VRALELHESQQREGSCSQVVHGLPGLPSQNNGQKTLSWAQKWRNQPGAGRKSEKMDMKKVIGLIVWVLWIGSSIAAEYRISSATDLRTLEPKAGYFVIMMNRTCTDQQLLFQGLGKAKATMTPNVGCPGSEILTESTSLTIEGMWLVVDGLSFRDGYTLKENVFSV